MIFKKGVPIKIQPMNKMPTTTGDSTLPVYRVFISSTFQDLQLARQKVKDAILSLYLMPLGMEMFGAANRRPWEVIKRDIDSSNCYVLIIGDNFGSEVTGEGISYTQKEFRYAKSTGRPILAFIRKGTPSPFAETDPARIQKLKAFKAEVEDSVTVDYWENPDHLASKVGFALAKHAFQPNYKNPQLDQQNSQAELFEEFRKEITPILKAIVDVDPTGSPVKLDLFTDIEYFLNYWKWPEKKFSNSTWERYRQESLSQLSHYYSLFDGHFHLLEGREPASIFVTLDSVEAGRWLNEVLRPQSIEIRTKCAEIYQKLYE